MNVVIYARYSSDKQNEQSITGQLRVCHEYATRMGYKVIGEYCDRATSGTSSEHRYEFLKMVKDSEKRKFDGVIVYKLDRFARNRYDSAMYRSKLKKNNVRVLSAMENLSDSPEGVLMESLLEGMAEYYSLELSQKVKRGLRDSAQQCKHVSSSLPFGYMIDDERNIILDPKTSHIAKAMFEEYASGETIMSIMDKYNSLGYKHKGLPFTKNKLNRMLQNERYIGTYMFMDIKIENGIPAIIDEETFALCKARLNINKKHSGKNKANVKYLLSTRIFCADCGSSMCGENGTGANGTKHHYYKCRNRKSKTAKCDSIILKKDAIENHVLKVTNDIILNDEMINLIADKVVALLEKEKASNENVKHLERKIHDIDKGINNLITAIEMGAFTKSTAERLKQLEAEKEDLKVHLDMEILANNVPLTKGDIILYLSSFKNFDIENIDVCEKIIDMLVDSVYVKSDVDVDGNKKTSVIIKYNTSSKSSNCLNYSVSDVLSDCSDLSQLVPMVGLEPTRF